VPIFFCARCDDSCFTVSFGICFVCSIVCFMRYPLVLPLCPHVTFPPTNNPPLPPSHFPPLAALKLGCARVPHPLYGRGIMAAKNVLYVGSVCPILLYAIFAVVSFFEGARRYSSISVYEMDMYLILGTGLSENVVKCTVGNECSSASMDGVIVHVSGELILGKAASDTTYNVTPPNALLVRRAHEIYSYSSINSDEPPSWHESIWTPAKIWHAERPSVRGLVLSQRLVEELARHIPYDSLSFVIWASEGSNRFPKRNDERHVFDSKPAPRTASFVGRVQDGRLHTLLPPVTSPLQAGPGLVLSRPGMHSALELASAALHEHSSKASGMGLFHLIMGAWFSLVAFFLRIIEMDRKKYWPASSARPDEDRCFEPCLGSFCGPMVFTASLLNILAGFGLGDPSSIILAVRRDGRREDL
jgi:hypothetical protein